MNKRTVHQIIHYLSRAIAVGITAFFSLFILEGFGPDFGWQDSVAHAVPAAILGLATFAAWKKPVIGGLFFIACAIAFGVTVFLTSTMPDEGRSADLLFSMAPILLFITSIGVLFLVDARLQKTEIKRKEPDK